MKQHFIKTTDELTAEQLISMGFRLMSHVGETYTFLNEPPKNFQFENVDSSQIVYSNVLCF